MSDIFLSYARDDRKRVDDLAAALEAEGYDVWWDRHIDAGSEFSGDIERELEAARAVIVCWSQAASSSRWVKDEANVAADADKLVAIALDGSQPPIGFRQYHALDISGWTSEPDLPDELARAVANKLGGPSSEPTVHPVSKAAAPRSKTPIVAIAVALLVALGGIWWWQSNAAGEDIAADRVQAASLAVLPFEALSDDESDAYFGKGIAEELLNALAEYPELKVSGRASAFELEDQGAANNEIGDALGVDHLLRGSVRRAGDRVRISAQLLRATDGSQLWSETYERELTDIFSIQDEIVGELARVLQFQLGVGAGRGRAARDNVEPRAYAEYLRGLDLWWQRTDTLKRREAIATFKRVTELDPKFADGWAMLATGLSHSAMVDAGNLSVADHIATTNRAFERALELDPDNVPALSSRVIWEPDISKGLAHGERAVALAPNSLVSNYTYGLQLTNAGRYEEAREHLDRAHAIDPLNLAVGFNRAFSLGMTGYYDDVRSYFVDNTQCAADCNDAIYYSAAGLEVAIKLNRPKEIRFWRDRVLAYQATVADKIDQDRGGEAMMVAAANEVLGEPDSNWDWESANLLQPDERDTYARAATLVARYGRGDNVVRALDLLEEGYRQRDLNTTHPAVILREGPLALPESVRRHPRYHALFDNYDLKALAEMRRANGQTAGLPLPIQP